MSRGSVGGVATGGDHDHRDLLITLLEASQHVETVDVGKTEVEKLEVDTTRRHPLERGITRGNPLDIVPLPGKGLADERRDQRVVLDDQYVRHAFVSSGQPIRAPGYEP